METYRDWDNDSNIAAYEIGNDFIIIQFKSGQNRYYKYTYASAGVDDVEEMKNLARAGDGLNSFVSTNKPDYESKW